ncbi:N-acetyldiaminopimelate deacetylase [Anaerotignum neopropionicum]|uniref:N-acetyldiaminopimelate deacetylase n=1 Tax=Anaerotignum neopropionicum TaxID=36847 RepID=A0A136WIG2_9FIRM|nr:M20 family metallopeptidase [Anaerotignum neopropionicum]KXL54186.1 N-acetyldiaminopimelate deacetylase [Anaerotignum neopropionicum]KXL54311.1 N-acetyldiaminopimelate deacetylase [Anaerotignum neopropionicum]
MRKAILNMEQELRQIRRDLHRIPELGLSEHKTAAYIENMLHTLGVDEVERCLETGVIGLIRGKGTEKPIAFRADMDALTVQEPPRPYASCHEGLMHACGHDGHMTILLGFAKYLMAQKERPKGDVVLIFQPAEEGPGGARLMVEAGIIEKYNISKVIGCHIFPDVPQGKIACRAGGMMARNGEVSVRILGKSSHGAQPHLGADALLAAGAVINGLHTILSRNISPLESGILSFGSIHGGEACNIVAKEVCIEGTMRAFSDEVYEKMVQRIEAAVKFIAEGYGCEGVVAFRHMYRVVNNDAVLVHALEKACGDSYLTTPPYMLAEDFSFFQQAVPGLFFFLGAGNEEKGFIHPLHSGDFDFDEKILCFGVETYMNLLLALGLT